LPFACAALPLLARAAPACQQLRHRVDLGLRRLAASGRGPRPL